MSLIAPHHRLYNYNQPDQVRLPEKNDESTINMISMITSTTTPEQFDEAWKENPDYQLENVGPKGPICKRSTSIQMAFEKNNPSLGKYLINKLKPEYINASNYREMTLLNSTVIKRYMFFNNREDANLECICKLVASGANVNLPYPQHVRIDGFNENPLSFALRIPDVKLTKILLQHGAEKYWAYNPNKTALIKQKFTEKENKVYKLAKKEIMDSNLLFIFASKLGNSSLGYLPKEIVAHILTCDRVIGTNHHLVENAKREIITKVALIILLSTLVGKTNDSNYNLSIYVKNL